MFALQNPEKIVFVSMAWQEVSEKNLDLFPNIGYRIIREEGVVTLLLPESAPVNSEIKIDGRKGGWEIAQRSGQQIDFGNLSSTPGTQGGMRSTDPSDFAELICLGEGRWKVCQAIGNFNIF